MAEDPAPDRTQLGYIERLAVENFMSHRKFEIQFNPLITMIVGPNGSGKSAILTALMVLFGSRSKDTGRGSKVHGLVKEGETTAYVMATVRLPGGSHDVCSLRYGASVTIERRINASSTTLVFRDANGTIVRPSKPGEELRRIARHCGIFPSNPLAVLTQEVAKKFLNASTPKDKYKRIQEAFRVSQTLSAVKETEDKLDAELKLKKDGEETNKALEDKLARDREFFRMFENVDENLVATEKIVKWRAVKEAAGELSSLESELAELDSQTGDQTAEINQRYQQQLNTVDEDIVKCNASLQEARDALLQSDTDLQAKHTQLTALSEGHESVRKQVEAAQTELQEWKAEQTKLMNRPNAKEHFQEIHSIAARLEAIESERAELESRIGLAELDLPDKAEAVSAAEQLVRQHESQIGDLKVQSQRAHQDLRSLQQSVSRGSQSRGDNAINQIIRSEPEWSEPASKRRPIGPLRDYVEVTDPKWQPVLEQLLSRTNDAYWVQSDVDSKKFQGHLRRRKITARVYARRAAVFSFEAGSIPVKPGQYTRVLDTLKFKSDEIQCLYVDYESIEGIALCDSIRAGLEIMRAENRPANLRSVICFEDRGGRPVCRRIMMLNNREITEPFHLFNRSGAMKSSSSYQEARAEEHIRELQEAIQSSQGQLIEAKDRLSEARRVYRAAVADLEQLRAQIVQLKKEEEALGARRQQLQEIEDAIPHDESRLSQLENLISVQERQVSLGREEVKRQAADLSKAKREMDAARGAKAAAQSSIKTAQQSLSAFHLRRDTVVQAQDNELLQHNRQHRRSHQRRAELEEQIEAAKAAVELATAEAETAGGDISAADQQPDKSTSDLEAHIRQLIIRRERLDPGVLERRRDEHTRAADELVAARTRQQEIGATYEILKQATADRKANVKDEWNYLKRESAHAFRRIMRKIAFKGSLEFDDEKETLVMHTARQHGEQASGTLSGGERSFTQLALIVSIWRSMAIRLVAMDEYDVFMDGQTSHRALVLMIECLQKCGQQCILITHSNHDASTIADLGDKISIYRLDNPRS